MARDIDDTRDKARDDARRQKELERSSNILENVEGAVTSKHDPPSGPDKEEYERVYRNEKKR